MSKASRVTKVEMIGGEKKIAEKNSTSGSIENFFTREITILRLSGLFSMKNVFSETLVKFTIWEALAYTIGFAWLVIIIWTEFHNVLILWNYDLEKAIMTLSTCISGFLSIIKGLELWLSRKKLPELMRRLSVIWKNVKITRDNIRTAERAHNAGKFYIIMMISTCSSYALRPYVYMLHYYCFERLHGVSFDFSTTIFPSRYFWPTDSWGKYFVCLFWEKTVLYFVAVYSISTDVLFLQFTSHAAIQFQVLAYDLKYLSSENRDRKNENKCIQILSEIAKRHHELYRFCEFIKDSFQRVIFFQLLLTSINICMCIVHLEKETLMGNWVEVAKIIFHVIALVVQGSVYCSYAENLTEQSKLVGQAAYDSQWTSRSQQFKIILQFIIMRSQRPFKCTAYNFFSLSLEQLTKIFKAAGSYFTILKSLT